MLGGLEATETSLLADRFTFLLTQFRETSAAPVAKAVAAIHNNIAVILRGSKRLQEMLHANGLDKFDACNKQRNLSEFYGCLTLTVLNFWVLQFGTRGIIATSDSLQVLARPEC